MKSIPVYVLSGFLGSGKTTLLTRILNYLKLKGKRPAVIMNEIGDVNLDGLLINDDVPVAEMLNGCICCTIREDLSSTLLDIYHQVQPDVIVIESTGIANPLELIEGITNASLIAGIELRLVTTVVSAPHFLALTHAERGKTRRLMEEQIRCADLLLLNKTDQLTGEYNQEVKNELEQLNPHAKLVETLRCEIGMDLLFTSSHREAELNDQNVQQHSIEKMDEHSHHHTHKHVMTYTHRFDGVVDRQKFENLFSKIPTEVYRAKGIIKFTKDKDLYLFQFAYRELEIIKIKPQQSVEPKSLKPVAVFIGEHFDKIQVKNAIQELTSIKMN
ncbi:CobW family GTP-binding protein [Peribacillus frigoritolerans]|uniref:CobW family GTP-binding protein n=1 Tax=Peribacillus frigoritolerans TaxID=450367 RepID=UPI0025A2E669|nr:GTP-binding protein [Peribacillus frigoritolerans]MDM5306974.1 GTP-binding protein [Peribacillus frigoritolerans]